MRKKILIPLLLVAGIGVLQLFGPKPPMYKPVNSLGGLPASVDAIFRKSCFNCHSTETNLKWYDKITPANYLVYDHVRKGRKALDFSRWDSLAPAAQNGILYYSVNKILEDEMPLSSYTAIHREAKLSDEDIRVLKQFLISRTPRKPADSAQINKLFQEYYSSYQRKPVMTKATVQPAPNGIEYISDYRNWKVISISDRFDNGTMRMIYGNDVAVKAIQQHATNPWPDGSILAKAAWKQQTNVDGSIAAGEFFQVEFMIKDANKYKATDGWGWARWRGADLKPYGGTPLFTSECTSCHKPMEDNDHVFTKPLYLKDDQQKTTQNEK